MASVMMRQMLMSATLMAVTVVEPASISSTVLYVSASGLTLEL